MYPGKAATKNIEPKNEQVLDFKSLGSTHPGRAVILSPAVNIVESATEYVIALGAPGLRREDFSIEIAKNIISISAIHENIKTDVTDRQEYDLTEWTRKFALPADADPILAHSKYCNGELIIVIPRGDYIENKTETTIYVY